MLKIYIKITIFTKSYAKLMKIKLKLQNFIVNSVFLVVKSIEYNCILVKLL